MNKEPIQIVEPEDGYPLYTSIENKRQFEDALSDAGAFGYPIIGEGIEDEKSMQDQDSSITEGELG